MEDNWPQSPDAEIISACLDGNENAWQALISRYKRLVYSIPVKWGLSLEDAVDIFEAVWFDCFRELSSLRNIDKLQPWLVRVAVRKCHRLSKIKRARGENPISGSRDKSYEPPPWAFSNTKNLFKLTKPDPVRIAREIFATLVYDSFREQQPVGVRSDNLPARQALYPPEEIQLELKIELGDDSGMIVGQLVAETGDLDVKDLEIELTQGGEVIEKARANALGEFIFENLPKGNYELQLVFSDTVLKLPPLSFSN